jgi:Zn-dependent metalloprotease
MCDRRPLSCIVPPHIFQRLLESQDHRVRDAALASLATSVELRTRRTILGLLPATTSTGTKRRTIFDARNAEPQPAGGVLVRGEGGPLSKDVSVNEAYDGIGDTYDFYHQVFGRNSLDGQGMRLDGVVHYGSGFENAFWDGQRMVFGDGDGQVFTRFTRSLDVIAHELAHGVTEFTAGLEYHKQSGALNESMSDVFGSLVKQWRKHHDATSADWLIGNDVFTPAIAGDALRSLKAPGEAYDNALIGKDPQPRHMSDFKVLPDTRFGDNGGVHINSGIPNHAFYLAAVAMGGNAWDDAGHIWYESLTKNCGPQAQFQDFADATVAVAGRLFGASSLQQKAVRDAWRQVGLRVTMPASARDTVRFDGAPIGVPSNYREDDSLEALQRQIAEIATAVDRLEHQRASAQ